jgi:hypothetical protein
LVFAGAALLLLQILEIIVFDLVFNPLIAVDERSKASRPATPINKDTRYVLADVGWLRDFLPTNYM